MNLPTVFMDLLTSESIPMKLKMLQALQLDIQKHHLNLPEYVDFIPDFSLDADFNNALEDEIDNLNFKSNGDRPETLWLCPTSDSYMYPDLNPDHPPTDINGCPKALELLRKMSEVDSVTGPLDALLVLKYTKPAHQLRPHADDEDLIDQTKSISAFTLGDTSTIAFTENRTGTGRRKKSVVTI